MEFRSGVTENSRKTSGETSHPRCSAGCRKANNMEGLKENSSADLLGEEHDLVVLASWPRGDGRGVSHSIRVLSTGMGCPGSWGGSPYLEL